MAVKLNFRTYQTRGRSAEGWWNSPALTWIYGCGDSVGIFIPNPNSNYAQFRIFKHGREYFHDVWKPYNPKKKLTTWASIRDKINRQLSAIVREIEETKP